MSAFRPISVAFIATILLLAACSGPSARVVPRRIALGWNRPINCRVLDVYDTLRLNIPAARDPHVSDLIEVEIIDGDKKGERLTFPYDRWSVGRPPPAPGTELVTAPSAWVTPAKDSKGIPNPVFDR